MIGQLTEVRPDGSLYCDITPERLGLPAYTPAAGLVVKYPKTVWNKIGEVFLTYAQLNCPVDTGFLKENINFSADDGGVEVWSDATYSVFQEYGTSRMAAQPYFEAAIHQAIYGSGCYQELVTCLGYYKDLDGVIYTILGGFDGGIAELTSKVHWLQSKIPEMKKLGYDTKEVEEAIVEIQSNIAQIQAMGVQQVQNTGFAAWVGQMLGSLLVNIFRATARALFSDNKPISHRPKH